MIYINSYSLLSARGDSVEASVRAVKKEDTSSVVLLEGRRYYKIKTPLVLSYYESIEYIAKEAVSKANLSAESLKSTALFIGTSSSKLPLNEVHAKQKGEMLADLNISEIAERIAKSLGITGFRCVVSTACTSSANALIQAKEMIETNIVSKALVIGVELYNLVSLRGFESFMLLSDNIMKPFDRHRDGLVLGEAVSAVVLSRKRSPFVFKGGASKVDVGFITAPSVENLVSVMSEALLSAKIEAEEIHSIKAHATASIQNDKTEAEAIHNLFSTLPNIVALKPYIGHTMGACGSSELALFLEALNQGFVPKSQHFKILDPECNIKPTQKTVPAKDGHYLFNYFGFGGNNSTIVVQYRREN